MNAEESSERSIPPRTRAVARVLLTVYAITLTLIALWPVPVDSGAGGFLRAVARVLPALTYSRIEFAANILLFVPLGVLLMLIVRRRYLILPTAIVVTVSIESVQGLLLDQRTPSVLDIIANTAGACFGMLVVSVAAARRARAPQVEQAPQPLSEGETWAALGLAPPVPPAPPAPGSAAAMSTLPAWIPPMPPLPGERARA